MLAIEQRGKKVSRLFDSALYVPVEKDSLRTEKETDVVIIVARLLEVADFQQRTFPKLDIKRGLHIARLNVVVVAVKMTHGVTNVLDQIRYVLDFPSDGYVVSEVDTFGEFTCLVHQVAEANQHFDES